jgi:GNAT superfamily N-acetyltransferase
LDSKHDTPSLINTTRFLICSRYEKEFTIEFYQDKACNLIWLRRFYSECGYSSQFGNADDVYYVSNNDVILGVVRISKEYGVYILRGMQVLPSMRGQKIGRQLLAYLELHLQHYPSKCFCLPHEYLTLFYSGIGFNIISDTLAPEFIRKRKEQYSLRGLKISLMVRDIRALLATRTRSTNNMR